MILHLRWLPWQSRWLCTVLVALSALWLGACNPASLPTPWRIAVNPWMGCEPWVFAQEMGTLPQAMRVVELASSTETKRAFRNGLIEVAALTWDEALRLADEGEALHIVAVLSESTGADNVLVARPDLDISRLAALLLAWDHARQQLTSASGAPPWMAAGIGLTPSQYQQTLNGLRFLSLADMLQRLQPTQARSGSTSALPAQGGQARGAVLQRQGLIRQPPDWGHLLNPEALTLALAFRSTTALEEQNPSFGGRP